MRQCRNELQKPLAENGADAIRFAEVHAEFCANAVRRAVFGAENGSDVETGAIKKAPLQK